MSVNTAHANDGVLIHSGEFILLHCKHIAIEFFSLPSPLFQETKINYGHIYLTSHRMIFRNNMQAEALQSFSAPFIAIRNVKLQRPVSNATYIKGNVHAQPNGNFTGEVKFKLHFKFGGAVQYAQALLCAAALALQNCNRKCKYPNEPPPYTPCRAWYEAPSVAYERPRGYYDWLPTNDPFTSPAPNSVFMSDNPPPYPGIGTPTIQQCRTLPLDPFASPPVTSRCPTPVLSFDGLGRPPIYGKFQSEHQDGIFPHQAGFPTLSKACYCLLEDSSESTSIYGDAFNSYENFDDDDTMPDSFDYQSHTKVPSISNSMTYSEIQYKDFYDNEAMQEGFDSPSHMKAASFDFELTSKDPSIAHSVAD